MKENMGFNIFPFLFFIFYFWYCFYVPNSTTIFCLVVEKGELKDIRLKLEFGKAQLNIHIEYFGLNSLKE